MASQKPQKRLSNQKTMQNGNNIRINRERSRIYKLIMTENFPKLVRASKPQI